ncbi:toxin glutamine deamidase domain-containing protein [Tenggerimyces flavus]|uniref:Toxin glutamine deamidase domain-containing protein n=1 Tax=Tenggerimyces flavus TaxID=1708749 RepID=A0ABV7YMX6_9ACTN|nr:toxin glutamine deamidase domain-containing protein [Tenggerimyces flavus]MBM7786289.1 hypothetical protein [Tenggerimyces flavus]
MPDLRESVDATPIDAAHVRELDRAADAKAFDPRTPTYNPSDHVSTRREPAAPAPGLDSPVLLSLSAKVHAASADRFEPRVGGTSDSPAAPRPDGPEAAVESVEVPETDAFGPIDADRYREVPCVECRPQRAYELHGSKAALTEGEVSQIREAQEHVAEVLDDAGEDLTADDVQEALQYINPTRSEMNCVECAKSVDDVLSRRAAVAGPTPDQPPYELKAALSVRSLDYLDNVTSADVEQLVAEAGPGARGIVVGWRNQRPVHAYNVANIDGEVFWLDGQQDLMTERNPHNHKSLEFYLTSGGGQQ